MGVDMVKASELDQKANPAATDSVVIVDRESNPISSKRVPLSAIRGDIGGLGNVADTADSADSNNQHKILINDPTAAAGSRWRDLTLGGAVTPQGAFLLDGTAIRDNSIFDSELAQGNFDSIRGIGPLSRDINLNLNQIVGLGDPVGPRNAATKAYVDTAISGVSTSGGAASLGALNNVPAGADTVETFVQYLRKAPSVNQWTLSRGVPATDVQGVLTPTHIPTLDIGSKTSGSLPSNRVGPRILIINTTTDTTRIDLDLSYDTIYVNYTQGTIEIPDFVNEVPGKTTNFIVRYNLTVDADTPTINNFFTANLKSNEIIFTGKRQEGGTPGYGNLLKPRNGDTGTFHNLITPIQQNLVTFTTLEVD